MRVPVVGHLFLWEWGYAIWDGERLLKCEALTGQNILLPGKAFDSDEED